MKGVLALKKHPIKENDLIPVLASSIASSGSGFTKLYFSIDDDTLIVKEKLTSQKPLHRLLFAKLDNFGVSSATDTMYFVSAV